MPVLDFRPLKNWDDGSYRESILCVLFHMWPRTDVLCAEVKTSVSHSQGWL